MLFDVAYIDLIELIKCRYLRWLLTTNVQGPNKEITKSCYSTDLCRGFSDDSLKTPKKKHTHTQKVVIVKKQQQQQKTTNEQNKTKQNKRNRPRSSFALDIRYDFDQGRSRLSGNDTIKIA